MQKSSKNPQKFKSTSLRGLDPEYVSTFGGIEKAIFTSKKGTNIDTLYRAVKNSPELLACMQAIIEDIMADGWRFRGSKSAISKAMKFQTDSNFFKIMTNAILEVLITGNAYILKLSVDEDKLATIICSLTKKMSEELEVKFTDNVVTELIDQSDVAKPKDLQLLKSSTVKINYDETGIVKSYEQRVNEKKRIYRAKDVIHLDLMNIGGENYGFTSLEPLLSDLATLIFAKEFAGKFFENDGLPFFLWNLPEAQPGDHAYNQLKTDLKEMKKTTNKYRSLVTTGKITAEQINKFNKDMEFPKLVQHFTQIILVAMGVPAHRINLTIDVRQIGGAVNRAYEGYYKKINFMQRIFENSFNKELWGNWNVEMAFKETYKIDEMREAQVVQILAQAGLVTQEEARELVGLDPEMPPGTKIMPVTQNNQGIDMENDKKQEIGQEDSEDKSDKKTR